MTYSKSKLSIILLLFFAFMPIDAGAQTYYYKLTSIVKNGTTQRNVSGGQFITFENTICQETNNKGFPVGNGYLQRSPQNANKYVGESYWGQNTVFTFSADKSSLKVSAPSGQVYNYTRSSAPAGVTTCSLIASGKNNSPSTSSQPQSTGGTYKPTEVWETCFSCHGTGKCTVSDCVNGVLVYWVNNDRRTTVCGGCNGSGKCATCHGSGGQKVLR